MGITPAQAFETFQDDLGSLEDHDSAIDDGSAADPGAAAGTGAAAGSGAAGGFAAAAGSAAAGSSAAAGPGAAAGSTTATGSTMDSGASLDQGDPAIYAVWVDLVERIQSGQIDGMTELYDLFSRGIRFHLCRHLGTQDLDDRVHDTFVMVVQAIRRGELREPQRLMGFVRTVVRRLVATHIEKAVQARREQLDKNSGIRVVDPRGDPEEAIMFRQRTELIRRVLEELGERDREILTRFYLHEEGQDQICAEMALTETQFRLLKSRAKARFGELGKKKLASRALHAVFVRTSAGVPH